MRLSGKQKALLISATGTGKTYLSAFDVKKFNPKNFLFVVHRLNIAQAAMRAYKVIFGSAKSMGIYSGKRRELEADFIFSTIQTISKEENLRQFDPCHFEYIVIDETHRAAADSYQNIFNYFKPAFLLGMTATPERTDDLEIFKLFDYNIAFEIRLHRALEENLLSPFHYYGVTDIIVDGKILEENADFNLLASKERIDRILEKADIYGCDNGKVRGLIFCSSLLESKALSDGFNLRGLKTISLSGVDNDDQRSRAISMLETNELQYIFTVDIFNEGIDIPTVNQIIMLRPTQSAIVFVQQLGRGLRKIDDKDYLTVIDFIGNYKNNFLVPIALYGDTSFNKDALRKYMVSGSSLIPGTSTINFDEISRAKIFEAIDAANMQLKRDLVKDYKLLRERLGRIPKMIDFIEQGSRDPQLFIKYSRSYFNFVEELEGELKGLLDSRQRKLLELFANEINNSKRVEESIILKHLLNSGTLDIGTFKAQIKDDYGYEVSSQTIDSCLNNLNFKFITENKDKKLCTVHDIYGINVVKKEGNKFIIDKSFSRIIENATVLKFLLDNAEYAIQTFNKLFIKLKFTEGFVLYRKYSRKDVFRILNWQSNPLAQNVGGYMISSNKDNCPIFVNYHKEDSISSTTKYEDGFINSSLFEWMSKSSRYLQSPDVTAILNAKNGLRLPLFIKKYNNKEDKDDKEFYFMGDVIPIENSAVQAFMPDDSGKQVSVVKIVFSMIHPVEDAIYEYITTPIVTAFNDVVPVEEVPDELSSNPFRILPANEIKEYVNCIPLYDIKVAAGDFSDLQNNIEPEWIELTKPFKYSKDYFVCQVVGESMNKIIPHNSWCLFKKDPVGSRSGKIVLAHAGNIQDADFGKGFTVKLYESEKVITDEIWSHTSIILKPQSYNEDFQNLILKEDDLTDFKIEGIFVEVLN